MPGRQGIEIDMVYYRGRGGVFESLPLGNLPRRRYELIGTAVRDVIATLEAEGCSTADIMVETSTRWGMGMGIMLDGVHRQASVYHRGHSDVANQMLDRVSAETGWISVDVALNSLNRRMRQGLDGHELAHELANETLPCLRRWKEALIKRDTRDERLLEMLALSLEKAPGLGLEVVYTGPEPGPLHGAIDRILRADDPAAVIGDDEVREEAAYY